MAHRDASLNKHKIKPLLIVRILLFILSIRRERFRLVLSAFPLQNKINRENGNDVFVFFILFSFTFFSEPVSSKCD